MQEIEDEKWQTDLRAFLGLERVCVSGRGGHKLLILFNLSFEKARAILKVVMKAASDSSICKIFIINRC